MEEKISAYLKEKYNPDAIILHGSRAIGEFREHSDWDFIFLYKSEKTVGAFRELIENQNIEIQSHTAPLLEEDILDTVGLKLQNARVLFEIDDLATDLLNLSKEVYARGFVWPDTWPTGTRLWMQGRIDGMKDTAEDPSLFYRYFCQFYPRAISDWFRVLHKEFPKPEYIALPEIKERDLEYYKLLEKLVNSKISLKEKASISQQISDKLFN